MVLRLFSATSVFLFVCLIGCGSGAPQQSCSITYPIIVTPASATLDHVATRSGNQVQFVGIGIATSPAGCPQPTDLKRLEYASWNNPDTVNIQISSALNQTNGTASCLGATNGPVTLTGTFAPITIGAASPDTAIASVTLTCK
jgi:hypothetical protein